MEWSVESSFTFKLLLTTAVSLAVLKAVSLLYRQFYYWKNRGVPYIGGMPFFGTGWRMLFRRMSMVEYGQFLYNWDQSLRYVGIMDFATPAVMVRDAELIKDVAVKNFDNFPDHRSFVDENIDPIFGKNVFSLRGDRWKEMRNTLSPSFTASKMKFMYDLVSKCSKEFVDYLAEHPDYYTSVETKDLFTRYTTDVIATAAFGISVNSLKDPNNEFFIRGTDSSRFGGIWQMIKFTMFRVSPRLTKLMGLTFLSKEAMEFFQRVVTETLAVREKEGIVRPDMIHLLMQAREKASQDEAVRDLDIDDIVAQAFIFFLAGFDTSSTLMCHLMHELAMCPDVQEKLREEVDKYIAEGNGELSYESLAKMEYMDMVVSEALRKYPPVVFIDRVCIKEYDFPPAKPGYKALKLEPDSIVFFPVFAIQRDPKNFPDPDRFDPERFSEANKNNIDPYTYLPFGLGPRKCIGNRFALMETKILVAHLLHKFRLKPIAKTKHPIVFSRATFTLIPDGGFWLGLEPRKA